MDITNDIKQTFKEGSVLTRLIYINIGVFLLVKVLGVFFYLAGQANPLVEWLSLPSQFDQILAKPWTIFTYMFMHAGFLHLLFNVLGLYWFGKLFLYRLEGDKMLGIYLLGGLAGAFLYALAFSVLPVFEGANGLLRGASASVFAVLVAIAVYDPNQEIRLFFIGTFPLKYIAAFYVLLSVIGISTSNPGGNIAHVGGALWGWFYIFQLRKGNDISDGFIKLINSAGDKLSQLFKPKEKMTVTYKQPPRDDYEYNRQKNIKHEEINRILEKIAKSGYENLTKKEKEILFKQGK